ncbi:MULTISPECIES: HAD family hydrolase [unclassified Sporolactobacillus]|uniref:HAD family hydrolase n=1 Tax=unclassified Sporolactobacillus TaxID=2628533 RepID=UPI002368CBB5|nr:HAD family hydrolase [Sporolactobacillus sp. CQH2019]MDD9148774.1 HAD family hydrolase [Sporolactobacillus sp. CQH2019]
MNVNTVLFDFDGTLANTLPLAIYGMKQVFEKFDGRSFDENGIVSMFGPTEDSMIARNFRHKEKIQEAIDSYYQIYEDRHHDYVEDNSDIVNLLQELKELRMKIGVITGKSRRAYRLSEKALGFKGFFESVITGDDVSRPKPDPEGIKKTLNKFAALPETAIYIGDSNTDILAGKAAGIRTAAVQWLPVTQSSSFPARPDYHWSKVSQLIDWLKGERAL